VEERKNIRKLILDGRLIEVNALVTRKWPKIFETDVGLELHVQCLVELIRQNDYSEAIRYARINLWPYLSNDAHSAIAKQALGLFAIPAERLSSPSLPLLAAERRRSLADSLNRSLIFYPNHPKSTALEKIMISIAQSTKTSQEKAGMYGADFVFDSI
jgi:hypothetical protein